MYRIGWPWWLHVTLTFTTLTSWTFILTLFFVSDNFFPRLGNIGNIQRCGIFLISAFVTRATITNHETRLQLACWAVCALLFESSRFWMTGRWNGAGGLVCSVVGAIIGAVCARYLAHGLHWNGSW